MSEKKVDVGVGLYIYNDKNEVLLMHRKSKHGNGTWCPPGGHLEFWETYKRAAQREAKEESNLDINMDNINMVLMTEDFHESEEKHVITIHMETKNFSGTPEIMEPHKCTEIGWFTTDKLPSPLFMPCEKYFRSKKAS